MFKKIFLLVLIVFLFIAKTNANPILSPQPRCVSVLPTGDVTLTWTIPIDPSASFVDYLIYTSTSLAGPYTLLTTITTYAQTNYTHIGANANVGAIYYYIQSEYTNSPPTPIAASPLDTVCSMHLIVSNPGNGTAILSWNAIASPPISSSTGTYKIYMEFPVGTWSLVGTTNSLNFKDTIFVCNRTIKYKVEIDDNTGCTSVSSIDGGTFQNTISPTTPVFDTLSVDDNNNAIMSWSANSAKDVIAYVIYQFNGSTKVPIDTVYGINATNYNYLFSNADANSEQYFLVAYDSCGNISPLNAGLKTIFLTTTANICEHSATLKWSAYPTIGTGLAGYRVYQSTVSSVGPYSLITTVSAATLTYKVTGLTPNTTYYFKIQAVDNSGTKTSSSNRKKFFAALPIPPTFSYLRTASVSGSSSVDIICHVDVAASTLSYKIMRSTNNAPANYIEIGTVAKSSTSPITYTDNTANTTSQSYYYKVVNVDSCGFDGMQTNVARTILLTAEGNSETMTNTLTWNDYETWLGNVSSYNIYRGIDGVFSSTPIANIPYAGTGTNSYVDDISMQLQGQGIFNYYVEALEGAGNTYGFSETSLSNVADALQNSLVFIPNAFKPSGINKIFVPVTTFVEFDNYLFTIYNRWGQIIFSTTTVNDGWDGTQDGKNCELGMYVYSLKFKTSSGKSIDRKGFVTLIR